MTERDPDVADTADLDETVADQLPLDTEAPADTEPADGTEAPLPDEVDPADLHEQRLTLPLEDDDYR